jgi:hypothetical protein
VVAFGLYEEPLVLEVVVELVAEVDGWLEILADAEGDRAVGARNQAGVGVCRGVGDGDGEDGGHRGEHRDGDGEEGHEADGEADDGRLVGLAHLLVAHDQRQKPVFWTEGYFQVVFLLLQRLLPLLPHQL